MEVDSICEPQNRPIMKTIFLILFILSFGITGAWAQSYAGEDSARYYKSTPEKFDGSAVDIDCIFVTRVNGRAQVDGVTFFVAHTKDSDNRARGGSIVVAVLEEEAESFIRKYGTTLDVSRGAAEKVSSKRLRGIFHIMGSGHVYIDESGEAHSLIAENKDAALSSIRSGDGGKGPRGGAAKKRF